MDFPFDFPIMVTGKTVGQRKKIKTIEDCIAVIEREDYDPDNWTIVGIVIDGITLATKEPLREMIMLFLTTPAMQRQIDRAWDEHCAEALWETRETVQ